MNATLASPPKKRLQSMLDHASGDKRFKILEVRIHDRPVRGEPMLNRVEHGIRCYDPCLSCSTHAVGQMPLHVRLIGPDGTVLKELSRG